MRHHLTPLHVAAIDGHTDTVEALLARGGDPNANGKCVSNC